jgi:hypothetical protein
MFNLAKIILSCAPKKQDTQFTWHNAIAITTFCSTKKHGPHGHQPKATAMGIKILY